MEIVIFQFAFTRSHFQYSVEENLEASAVVIIVSYTAPVVFKASFNVVVYRSSKLCQKARDTGIPLIHDIFTEAHRLSYTTIGFNPSNCNVYWRTYTDADKMCSIFMRCQAISTSEQRTQ